MARKIDKIEPNDLYLDGHIHVYSNPRANANKWWRDPGSRRLEDLVKVASQAILNCIGIVNAGDDNNYERWTSQIGELPEDWDYYQDDRLTQVINPITGPIYFFKSEELFTKDGHVLVWGAEAGKKFPDGLDIDVTLDLVEKDHILTRIADHTFAHGGCGLIGSLDGREESFDAYEWNSMAGSSNKKTLEIAGKDKRPVVYGSDAHRPKYIGRAWNIFKKRNLSFKNGEEFIDSIKGNVINNNFSAYGELTPFAFIHHAYMIVLDHKFGLLNKDKLAEKN